MKHALLGPSGAKRWMACTPSARFEEEFEDKTSTFAEEGTAAHELAELYLLEDGPGIEKFKETNSYYNGEMQEAVELYLEIVQERLAMIRKEDPGAVLLPEQRLNFSDWVPEGFGTGDVTIIGAGIIEVIDLKYGKGVPVDAQDNPQLKLYGLGAWNTYRMLYDIELVRITIVQPRLGSVTTDQMTADELLKWANEEVAPKAKMAWAGEGEHVPGDHCKFCKAKPRCRALHDHNMELAKFDFKMPNKLTDEEVADVLGRIDSLTKWVAAVKEYALDQAENNGAKWPGWKLVEGRSNRVITDAQKAVEILVTDGMSEPLLYKPREVLGITALEKLVGKKHFTELLDDLIVKPAGKPTLVPESDKRPELNTNSSAAADFQ